MKRLVLLLATVTALAAPAAALAHPLGNFTTNRYTRIEVSGDRIFALYVLDLAEIPTYQARGEVRRLGRERYAAELASRLRGDLTLAVDGQPRSLRELRHAISFPPGAGGLRTTRLEVVLDGGTVGPRRAARIVYEDGNFRSRIGWREIVVRGSHGADVESSSVPARSVSDELRSYPDALLSSPLGLARARAHVKPGRSAGIAPTLTGTRPEMAAQRTDRDEGFAALVSEDRLSLGVVLVSLLAAMFWGAAHALTPGHGKAIVAAYLVGTRGTPRHALALGGIVTVTHTFGVFALGLVTLALSEFVVPEQLYPWLNLVSALLVVAVGVAVLRVRIVDWVKHGRRQVPAHHHHHHHHGDDHGHDHGPGGHSHAPAPGTGVRGLLAVGISGGLLPCPTALVVLLAAISLHRVGYGLLLIVAFSLGLASVVTGIGLLAIGAKRTFSRISFEGRVIRALPAVSALVIVGLGLAMTVRSLPALT